MEPFVLKVVALGGNDLVEEIEPTNQMMTREKNRATGGHGSGWG